MSVSFLTVQPLPPHIRVWDSVTLNTLHVIGMGVFDRAVTCVAFSKSVRRSLPEGLFYQHGGREPADKEL